MAIYFILFLIALSGELFNVSRNEKSKRHYLIIVFGCLLAVAMLRDVSVGTDLQYLYSKYYPQFASASWNQIQSVTMTGHWEWGFCALCKLLNYISSDVRVFIVATSLISIVPYGLFIYRNSKDVVMSTVFYVGFHIFTISLNIVRQSIAIGIILLGMEHLKRKEYMKFALYVLIASLVHTSAIIVLVLIVLDHIRFRRSMLVILTAITVVFSAGYTYVVNAFLGSSLGSNYTIYELGVEHAAGYVTFHTLGMFCITLYLFIVCAIYFNSSLDFETNNNLRVKKYRLNLREMKIHINHSADTQARSEYWSDSLLVYATYLCMVFRLCAFIINVAARFAYYFLPLALIAFPQVYERIESAKKRQIVKYLMYSMLILFFVVITALKAESLWGVIPYSLYK